MKKSVRVFSTPSEMASKLAEEIVQRIVASANSERPYSMALSGGSTPELLYSFLFDEFAGGVPWDFVHLFWGDERCVPPDSSESNYGLVKRYMVEKTGLPSSNVHRIKGEEEPVFEAMRYSGELSTMLPIRDKLPVFDLVLLGLGEDGHTASIFPDQKHLLNSERLCDVALHPSSGQKRITLTGKVINNAEAVIFLAAGVKKAGVVSAIVNGDETSVAYPAAFIKPVYGSLDFYLDRDAGSLV
ncbi:MAG TPA: 6-phosphogluconolactonase [Bacteroidales bacterium]|nr:6-phosphogluconolactonase [Bacteroidales bacterium]